MTGRKRLVMWAVAVVVAAVASGCSLVTRVSVSSTGAPADNASADVGVSSTGRYVVFVSSADNLVPGVNGRGEVYLHDALTGRTTLVSITSDGTPADDDSSDPSVVVRNLETGELTLAGPPPGSARGVAALDPSISADGRRVAYTLAQGNYTGPYPPDGTKPLLGLIAFAPEGDAVYDRVTDQTMYAPTVPETTPGGMQVQLRPDISPDGRYVAFWSYTKTLDPNGVNDPPSAWLWDTRTGALENIGAESGEAPSFWTGIPTVSRGGRSVAFATIQPDPNGATDVDGIAFYDRVTHKTTTIVVPGADPPYFALSDSGDALVLDTSSRDPGLGYQSTFEQWFPGLGGVVQRVG